MKPGTSSNSLVTGTLILAGAGLITRILGFFNRIYLSQLIGAKEMGLYQLIFPVYLIAFTFCCHGIELAIAQLTASHGRAFGQRFVKAGIFLSVSGALFFSSVLYLQADYISTVFLKEPACALRLRLMAPILPFTALRCCLQGYYMGTKHAAIPAAGQMIEQISRIFLIRLIAESYKTKITFSASLAVWGMVAGEIAGTLYTWICYSLEPRETRKSNGFKDAAALCKRALPLTGSRLSLACLSAAEAVFIPYMSTKYYESRDMALSFYGILTGMALPCITFPATLTNSLSLMLMPSISEARASGHKKELRHTIRKTVKLCLTLGFTAFALFFLLGRSMGTAVFHNKTAGEFLCLLSFLCPLLYLSSTGTSILNGLGYMKEGFFYQLAGIALRMGFVLLAVPILGIRGYLMGLPAGHLIHVCLVWRRIYRCVFYASDKQAVS